LCHPSSSLVLARTTSTSRVFHLRGSSPRTYRCRCCHRARLAAVSCTYDGTPKMP
jgi:hypothetical protein